MIRARILSNTSLYLLLTALLLLSAVLFFGAFRSNADATAVTISSSNQDPHVARTGDIITISFSDLSTASPSVSIDGHVAGVLHVNETSSIWISQYQLQASDPAGAVTFAITDGSGTVTGTSNGSYVTFFPAAPRVTLYSIDATPGATTSLDTLRVMAVFSEPVTGITPASFQTTDATVTSVTGSANGEVYIATIQPTAAGITSVSVPQGEGTDIAGNQTANRSMLSFTYVPSLVVSVGVDTTPIPSTAVIPATPSAAPASGGSEAKPNTAPSATTATPSASDLLGTSSSLISSSTTATTTGKSSETLWIGIIIIVLLLVGGGWWYSRNITTTA